MISKIRAVVVVLLISAASCTTQTPTPMEEAKERIEAASVEEATSLDLRFMRLISKKNRSPRIVALMVELETPSSTNCF